MCVCERETKCESKRERERESETDSMEQHLQIEREYVCVSARVSEKERVIERKRG